MDTEVTPGFPQLWGNLSTEGKAHLPKLEELGRSTLVMEWQGDAALATRWQHRLHKAAEPSPGPGCQGAHPWWGPDQGQQQLGSGWKGKQTKENSPKPPPGRGPYGGGPIEKAAGRETSGKGVEGRASGRGRDPFSLSGGWEGGERRFLRR